MTLRRTTRLLAPLLVAAVAHTAVAQTRHAILFAPGEYQSLAKADYHRRGIESVKAQLGKSGFDDERITLLVGAEATADGLRNAVQTAVLTVAPGDTVLVVISSYGFHVNGTDQMATHLTSVEADGALGVETVTVSEMVNDLAGIRTSQQLLVLDGYGEFAADGRESAFQFGRGLPTPSSGQVIVAARGGKLIKRNGNELTVFMQSFVDGLDSHADTNRNEQVSALELTKYMAAFAEDAHVSAPRLVGKLNIDQQPFEVGPNEQATFSADFNRQARQLLTEATQALHLELDAKAAINLVDRAQRLCRDKTLKAELADRRVTAQVLFRGAAAVLKTKPDKGLSWKLIVNKPTPIFEPGTNEQVAFQLRLGTVVQVSHRQGVWLFVASAAQPQVVAGKLQFKPLTVNPGYARIDDFAAPESQIVPSQYLKDQLAQSEPSAVR